MDTSRYLFREVCEDYDADGIINLVRDTGYHSDNLPRDNPSLIKAQVRRSLKDFAIADPCGNKRPLFMFVLEDTHTRAIVGTSLIKAMPYCLVYDISFERATGEYVGELALKPKEGVWELGGLLLSKEVRGKGLAKILSYGRLMYLATMNLMPRVLITGFFKKSFWEYIAERIDVSKDYDPVRDWRGFKTLSEFMRILPARIFLKDAGVILTPSRELSETFIPIQAESEPARKLLMDMWFRPFNEIEASGVMWYGGLWKTIRDRFMSYEIFQIGVDTCKTACHTGIGVAVLPSDDFRAQYVPLQKIPDGSACISKQDFPCGKPKRLFIF